MGNALSVARVFTGIWVPAQVTSSLCTARPGWVATGDPNETDDLDQLRFLPAHDFWDFRYRSVDPTPDQPGSGRSRSASPKRGFVQSATCPNLSPSPAWPTGWKAFVGESLPDSRRDADSNARD